MRASARLSSIITATALGATGALTTAPATALAQVEISISCGAVGQELELCRQGAEAWAAETGNTVTIVSTPNSTTERLALYQQLLAAGAQDIDVFQIDVIWPGILGQHFIDLAPYTDGAEDAHFTAIVENNTVGGELKAMPWYTDAGVLYYRADLLEKHGFEPPETWAEMEEAAAAVMEAERAEGQSGMWGFVYQGSAYEGLTCNALEWIDAFGGGEIVDADGEITINNENAVQAISMIEDWVGNIAPEGVLNYTEEEARGVFQSGNAVFMRNWPYAWSLAQGEQSPIRGKVGVVALPRGGEDGQNTGTLGGWNLAVSRYSDNADVAADLVAFLTSEAEQKRRAIAASYNPTIVSLYEDADVLEANPFFGSLFDTFNNAVARPSRVTGTKYNQVSNAFWNAVHGVQSGRTNAEDALASLENELSRIRRRGW
jgi:trehalose/maltose transport system substrate-binding protein